MGSLTPGSAESMYQFNKNGNWLAKNIVISQILGPKNEKFTEPVINNNLVKNIDHKRLAKNQWIVPDHGTNYCPNFYRGGRGYLEKFTQKQQIEIKLEKYAKNSLIITNNDIKKFKTFNKCGAFGTVFFLEDYDFENDTLSDDNNKLLKSKIVIKKQTRQCRQRDGRFRHLT